MAGYWQNPEATSTSFTADGWFRSGDVAMFDEDGYISIVDRMKDMYITGGENVYPAEVERHAYDHPAVLECAIVGVPDDRWGEVGAAFVVVQPNELIDPDEFRGFLRTRLAKYKVLVHVHVVDQLPRTSSGKVVKAALQPPQAAIR